MRRPPSIRARFTGNWLARARLQPRAMWGMWIAHLGVAAFCFGVTLVKTYEIERDASRTILDNVFELVSRIREDIGLARMILAAPDARP